MQASEIVDRLKDIVGKYTDDFSNIITVSSLTRSGTTATCITTTDHGLTTDDYVTIRGATNPVIITSLTRVDNVVTAIASEATQLIDPSKYAASARDSLTVTLSGTDPTEYSGTFKLLSVSDDRLTFTFEISDTPTTPATTAGYLLQPDYDGYNGSKQITVIDNTSFTFTVNESLNTPSQGTIKIACNVRIAWAATAERADEYYSKKSSESTYSTFMFVVLGSKAVYKDGTIASDISTSIEQNQDYFFEAAQDFSIYLYLPTSDDTLAGIQSDKAREYEAFILRSIANYRFSSVLTDFKYEPTNYVGNEADIYNTAYYVHRYDFTAKGFIQIADTIEINPGVPLDYIDGSFTDKNLQFKPSFK
jgi:hypothetical protein